MGTCCTIRTEKTKLEIPVKQLHPNLEQIDEMVSEVLAFITVRKKLKFESRRTLITKVKRKIH